MVTLHNMLTYSTICKTEQNSDRQIAAFITARFLGVLKGWWDHYLQPAQKLKILGTVKIENNQ